MKKLLNRFLDNFGYILVKKSYYPEYWDLNRENEPIFSKLLNRVSEFTMTSRERCFALYQAVNYVHSRQIKGDIVECGVWRGGSMMLAALTLLELGDTSRNLYLYDTFEGMSEPSEKDMDYGGKSAEQGLKDLGITRYGEWCYSSIEEVRANLISTGYPSNRINFIKGRVEETIPSTISDEIAILRLDTDWYASTYHELLHLYPKLNAYGVLIIDDYGHWRGAKEATDKYISENKLSLFLNRIDFTGRIALKI